MPRVGKNNYFPYTTQGLEDAKRFAKATGGEIVYDKNEKPEPEKADEDTGPSIEEMDKAYAAANPQMSDEEAEEAFQEWYGGWAKKAHLHPDPYHPKHYYDYKAAWKAGAEPEASREDFSYHWPSEFKLEDHPRMVVDGVNTKTGEKEGATFTPTLDELRRSAIQKAFKEKK